MGNYCNEKTINYIIKYVTKVDEDHKNYKSIILTSKGIGSSYLKTHAATKNVYNEDKTNENYRLNNGGKTALPIYYRNHIYSEEAYRDWETDRKSTRLNSSHITRSRMPSSA